MNTNEDFSAGISSRVDIEYPDFTKLSERVRQEFESLPTKVNFFRMLGYSPGTFVEIIDLTNAIFKNLTLRDYHKELLVLTVAAHEQASYEWEQQVSVARAAGVCERQFTAIAEDRFDDLRKSALGRDNHGGGPERGGGAGR
jgi:hypothetical protein